MQKRKRESENKWWWRKREEAEGKKEGNQNDNKNNIHAIKQTATQQHREHERQKEKGTASKKQKKEELVRETLDLQLGENNELGLKLELEAELVKVVREHRIRSRCKWESDSGRVGDGGQTKRRWWIKDRKRNPKMIQAPSGNNMCYNSNEKNIERPSNTEITVWNPLIHGSSIKGGGWEEINRRP